MAQPAPGQPTHRIDETGAPRVVESAPKRLELKKSWFRRADGALVLKREEKSRAVRAIALDVGLRVDGWMAELHVENELSSESKRYRLFAQKTFGDARAFAEWRDGSEAAPALTAGLEYSLFGEDRWLLVRKMNAEVGIETVEESAQLTFPLEALGVDKIRLKSVQGESDSELEGEVSTEVGEGLELGASVGSKRAPGPENTWSVPAVEGTLRFSW